VLTVSAVCRVFPNRPFRPKRRCQPSDLASSNGIRANTTAAQNTIFCTVMVFGVYVN
jgi:hypothetical protein